MRSDWEERLKTSYAAYASERQTTPRPVRLPSGIGFEGDADELVITLSAEGVVANMQTDAAAFEGWSLVMRRWCKVKRVIIHWNPPGVAITDSQRRHYDRFLYRVARFRGLVDWFDVEEQSLRRLEEARALSCEPLFLNVAGPLTRAVTHSKACDSESALERCLQSNREFADHYGFSDGQPVRQLPVGLFAANPPTRASQIFPAGKSAIDLICVTDQTIWLFELKARNNIKVGALSELIFYSSVLRDALSGGPFRFAEAVAGARIDPAALKAANRIEAVLLGHQLHPLIDARLLALLDCDANKHWNSEDGREPVRFRADLISGDDLIEIRPIS